MRTDSESRAIEVAAQLTLVELALGSMLHAFRVPFAGHALSLNQGLFLCQVTREAKSRMSACQSVVLVSSVAATLKSLSPAGNKLGPMISISMQGLLFSVGPALLGRRLPGQILGMALLSPWAFLQPALTLFLFYGSDLPKAIELGLRKIQSSAGISPEAFAWVLGLVVTLKLAIAIALPFWKTPLTLLGWANRARIKFGLLEKAQSQEMTSPPSHLNAMRGAARDLTRPLFVISLALMAVFVFLGETSSAPAVWRILRWVAVAFLFFYFGRSPWIPSVVRSLRGLPLIGRFIERVEKTAQLVQST